MKSVDRMNYRMITAGIVAALAFAACGDESAQSLSPEQVEMREAAMRQACAARQVEATAAEDLETLETAAILFDPSDPLAAINQQATAAAVSFSRAFHSHAQVRTSAYAYLDSAVNHAATRADSARYIERAGSFSIRTPQPGTVEANVLDSYEQKLIAVLQDENHRCNWDF